MADIAINLKGNDNLTGTVKQAEKAVKDLGSSAQRLNVIEKQFAAITDSGKPLQTQLRQIQRLMSEMNFDGLSNTEQFVQIAQYAGQVKDAISDAATATKVFSSDTRALDVAIQGFQGLAGATSVVTGAMALFGVENENVNRLIAQAQGALSMLNGVQQVANLLNKDSAVMLAAKGVKQAWSTAMTVAGTVATRAATVAEGAMTVKQKIATAVQTAWNVAKAIGKALLGDFSGLLLVGVGALATYAVATAGAKDEQEEMNDSLDGGNEAMESYTQNLRSEINKQITAYLDLKREWNSLSSDLEKTQFLEKNINKFQELDGSIRTTTDAENFLQKMTTNTVKAFIARAKASAATAAAAVALTDAMTAQVELDEYVRSQTQHFRKGSKVPDGETYNNLRNEKFADFERDSDGNWAWYFKSDLSVPVVNKNKVAQLQARIEKGQRDANSYYEKAVEALADVPQAATPRTTTKSGRSSSGGRHGGRHTTHTTKTTTKPTTTNTPTKEEEPLPQEASIADYNNKIAAINKQLETGNYAVGESYESLTQKLKEYIEKRDELQHKLDVATGKEKSEEQLKLEEAAEKLEENKKEVEKGIERLQGENSNINRNYVPENQESYANSKYKEEEAKITTVSSALDVLLLKQQELRDQLTASNAQIDFYHNLQNELSGLIVQYEELEAAAQDAAQKLAIGNILKGLRTEYAAAGEQMQTFEQQSGNIVTSLKKVDANVQKQEDNKAAWQNMQEEMQIATGFARDLGSAFSNMGDKSAKSIMDAAAATMTAVSQIIPQVLKLIGVKQAEAMAEGVASATKIGYPQNLIAIASIVATLMSTFATISGLKFAQGGIVPGGKFVGDHVLASVNSGEMILNTNQQRRLFNALNGGVLGGGNTNSTQHITLKVRGSDLVGALKNYQKINGRKL